MFFFVSKAKDAGLGCAGLIRWNEASSDLW
jgi:hypothetical protein